MGNPSSNIPSVAQIRAEYLKSANRVRNRAVGAEFDQATGDVGRGRVMELEAANRQQIKEEQLARAQQQDRGFEMLGGGMAGEQRRRQAVAEGGQRYNQAVSQLGIMKSKAIQDRNARADALLDRRTDVATQFAALQRKEQMQREMAQLQALQRHLDRQHATAINNTNNATRIAGLKAQKEMADNQIKVQYARIRGDLERTRIANPQYGGGTMTANFSTGANTFAQHLQNMGVIG